MPGSVLIVEQNPELRQRFMAAFEFSGYRTEATDRLSEALDMVIRGFSFDLIVVDASKGTHTANPGAVLINNTDIPVFLLKDINDKSMVIELLDQKKIEFFEHFIESHRMARSRSDMPDVAAMPRVEAGFRQHGKFYIEQ
jgi:DNA-binding response OmpR family regulator